MIFLLYSEVSAARIASSLGLPEYSYYFVLRDFLPVLQQLGDVRIIDNPVQEVDSLYDAACLEGQQCLFLSFSPPHKTHLGLRCPTIPVFAWEFDTIPNEHWLDEPNQNWLNVLKQCGRGITHSERIAKIVRKGLGEGFPIISIPSPVWDKYQRVRDQACGLPANGRWHIQLSSGVILDTHDVALEPYMPGLDAVANAVKAAREQELGISSTGHQEQTQTAPPERQSLWQITRRYLGVWYLDVVRGLLLNRPAMPDALAAKPALEVIVQDQDQRLEPLNPVEPHALPASGLKPHNPVWALGPCSVELSGVVFTSLFNPYDGRKNWVDMLTGFCAAFKDTPDATLLFKLGHHEYQSAMDSMLMCMARMPKFQCRVVLLQGYLEEDEFDNLIHASTFVVNASHGEGQCLPLMELLSCGKPAISPRHSAMLDYIDSDVAFVVNSWQDASAWSHDPRLAYRTCRQQIDWEALVAAFLEAYQCVKNEPQRYQLMSASAIERMRSHCSQAEAKKKLKQFLNIEDLNS